MKITLARGIIYVLGHPPMTREQYVSFRSHHEKEGDTSWPSYEALIDLDPEPQTDSDPSPSL